MTKSVLERRSGKVHTPQFYIVGLNEHKYEGGEGVSHKDIWGKAFLVESTTSTKSLRQGMCLFSPRTERRPVL